MKKYLVIVFLLSSLVAVSQNISTDSLRRSLLVAKEDTSKIRLLRQLAFQYLDTKPDSSIILYKQGLALARQRNLIRFGVIMLSRLSNALARFPAKKDSALLCMHQAMVTAEQNSLFDEEATCYRILSELYFFKWNKLDSGFLIARKGIEFTEKHNLPDIQVDLIKNEWYIYIQTGKPDSALVICFDGILSSQKKKLPEFEAEYLRAINNIFQQIKTTDTMQLLMRQALALARKYKQKKYEGYFLLYEGQSYGYLSKYSEALQSFLAAIKIFESVDDNHEVTEALSGIGRIYYNMAEYSQSLLYNSRDARLREKLQDSFVVNAYQRLGFSYAKMKMHDSAVYYAKKCYTIADRFDGGSQLKYLLDDIAEIYAEVGEDSLAMLYFRRSLPYYQLATNDYDDINTAEVFAGIAKLFKKADQNDSAFYYARLAFPIAQAGVLRGMEKERITSYLYDASNIIADYYKTKRRFDSAFVYREIEIAAKDSLSGQEKLRELRNIEFNEILRQQQTKEDAIKDRNRINTYFFIGGIVVILLIALLLYRNNRIKQKANLVLREQKQKVENTLEQLKSTQQQLVQSEKMASLGELTAGIAHEIQNPLNFVNNFSEVNNELLKELKTEAEKGNLEEVKAIANDIAFNSEKINHHGKRADSIVKGMLQHSRTSTGAKELTDVNALCDEYLRLAYHGLRAKDKSFNATTKTEFDNSIGKVNIVSQDIGRVILNLINNAFYAVNEKANQNIADYEPIVTVSTKKEKNKVEITVKDNGNGIPKKILDKIFQPFFTTKPTGQGTGLGLSLAYDIVTKGHGGELKVETKEGDGATFIIQL